MRLLPLLVLAWTLPIGAQQRSVDDIIARHLQARGGAERLKSIRSVVYRRGTYREPGFNGSGNAFMAMARPFYKIVGDPGDSTSAFREGYDGSAWEWYRDPGIVVRTVGAANAAIRHNLDPDGPFSDYRAKGTSIENAHDASVAGQPAYGLLVTLRDGFRQLYFIDKITFLVSATRQSSSIHAFGESVAREERYDDYRDVGGVLFPFRSVETEIATGKELSSMQWGIIEINRDLPGEWFSPPTFARTALQSVLEQLYYERADTAAVRWTYAAFRRAYPEKDTRSGVEAIGYQMLKMGDLPGAIALLQLNASDHTQSSTSAFALGRAYLTAGDSARARGEYERAVRLDPANKRAADALAAMKRP